MFKWVSLIKVSGKGRDKKEGGAFNSATLPLPLKMETAENSMEMKAIRGKYDAQTLSSLDGLSQDASRRSWIARTNDELMLEIEDCILCKTPGMRCLQLRKKIHREERLRDGADRLLGMVSDAKVRIRILSEMTAINTKLQSLREQHSQLNSVDAVAGNVNRLSKKCFKLPMLSPELKEVKILDCFAPLKNYLRSHYYEDPESFQQEFQSLSLLRKKCSNLRMDEEGLECLYHYYNQLFFIERRFFPDPSNNCNDNDNHHHYCEDDDNDGDDDHHHEVIFEWYDAFTGMKSSQSSASFEKGCLIFNMGVLNAKIAIRRRKLNLPDKEHFLRSAGAFRHLREQFNNAPSCDLQWNCSEMLMELMLLQQHEVLVEEDISTTLDVETDFQSRVTLVQYVSYLSKGYSNISSKLSTLAIIPRFWWDLIDCKHNYYDSLCHYLVSLICLKVLSYMREDTTNAADDDRLLILENIMESSEAVTEDNLEFLATSHIKSSINCIEEALRKCTNHMKLQFAVQQTFKQLLHRAKEKLIEMGELNQFDHHNIESIVKPKPGNILKPIPACFPAFKVQDLFLRLGCLSIFSSRHKWSHPRVTVLDRSDGQELGFSVSGDRPAIVAAVDALSPASNTSMRAGDFIVAINDVDVKWLPHRDVIEMIKSSNGALSITLVTPRSKNNSGYRDDSTCTESISSGTLKDFSSYHADHAEAISSTNTSKKSLVLQDQGWKNSKILSVLKSESLSRTFQTLSKKMSEREEIVNTDSVVIMERN